MDRQQYLNQISNKNKSAVGRSSSKLDAVMHSKFTWIILGAVVLLVIIMMIGAGLGNGKTPVADQLTELILRVNYVKEEVDAYKSNVKNSALRGQATTLSGVLGNSSTELTKYASAKYGFDAKKVNENIQTEIAEQQEELDKALFEAKITGRLDKVFANKISYEMSLIINAEKVLLDTKPDDTLDKSLNSSYSSLTMLYPKFDEFTEG